ncbi:MAG: AGE family epimerase/isomerase [Oscillospiraceae bacterium]
MKARKFKEHLEKNLIPFWNRMEDIENGGFYGYADSDGVPDKNSVKGCILNSRILWFYSASYQLLKKSELLEKAEHAYQFLSEHFYDSRYGGVFWSVKADGTPEDTIKHTYNQAFAVYALSVYYQASGKKEALKLAYSLYHIMESKCRDAEGYFEAFSRDFSPVSNEKLSENGVIAERTMNTLLHVLEAYTELYRADEFYAVGDSIRNILRIFKFRVYDSDKEICRVFFDKSYHSLISLESYGHDIEASWLIDRACQVLDDKAYYAEMLPMIRQLADGAYKNGIDISNQAMNNECENGTVNAKKVWWVQAEAVTGFYNAYQNQPEKTEYLQISENVWDYIQKHIIDKKTGEWIEDISPDNTVKSGQALAHPWKCPYHNGRMCIEMIRRLSPAT